MKSLILYDSIGGNTEKVAQRIYDTLKGATNEVEFFEYGRGHCCCNGGGGGDCQGPP